METCLLKFHLLLKDDNGSLNWKGKKEKNEERVF